jgi:xanthosine utilization system XapX-like protein
LSTGSDAGDGAASGATGDDPNDPNRPNRAEDELDQGGDGGAFSGDTVVAAVRAIDPRPALAFLGLLLLLLALAVARFNWRFRRYGPIESAWGKTRLLASYVGYPAHPSQTTYEFASSLGAAIPETHDPVQSLAKARVLEQYSAGGADEDLRDAAETAWHQLASAMLALLPGRVLRFITHLWR